MNTMRERFLDKFEYFKRWSACDELTEEHADDILDFIEQELKKEREEIIIDIEKVFLGEHNNYEEIGTHFEYEEDIVKIIKKRV